MLNPRQPSKTGFLRSLGEWVVSMFRKGGQVRTAGSRNKKTNIVTRYQHPLKVKRLVRVVNFCLAVLAIAACIGWLSYEMLTKSDILQVAAVEVQGNRMVTKRQVLDKADLNRGGNLLDIDMHQASENIKTLAWVDDVQIRRNWPSTVEIEIREHKPLALINIADASGTKLHYVDVNGHVFTQVKSETDLDFPVLTGKGLSRDLQEMQIKSQSLTEKAMRFLELAAQGNQILPLQAVSEIQISPEDGLIVYLVDYPFPIYMGQEKIRERFYLLVRVLAQLYNKDKVKEIKEIRMNYAEDKIMVASTGSS